MTKEQDWAPEPWRVAAGPSGRSNTFRDAGDVTIGVCPVPDGEDNARRAVACVNACWQIPTEDLEAGPLLRAAKALHEAAWAAVNEAVWHEGRGYVLGQAALEKLRAAVRLAEGG